MASVYGSFGPSGSFALSIPLEKDPTRTSKDVSERLSSVQIVFDEPASHHPAK